MAYGFVELVKKTGKKRLGCDWFEHIIELVITALDMDAPLARLADGHVARLSVGLPIRWDWYDISTQDGFPIHCSLQANVSVGHQDVDLHLVGEKFLTQTDLLTVRLIHRMLSEQIGLTMGGLLRSKKAAEVHAQGLADETAILTMLNQIGFGYGLEFLSPAMVSLRSSAYERFILQKTLTNQRAESSALVHRLLQASNSIKTIACCVAGDSLVMLPVGSRDFRVIKLPDTIGALRSVHIGHSFLIGGQRGLFELDKTNWTIKNTHTFDSVGQRGINSIAESDDNIIAAHGDIGIIKWQGLGEHLPPIPLGNARRIIEIDNVLLVDNGQSVFIISNEALRAAPSSQEPILATARINHHLIIARESGLLEWIDPNTSGVCRTIQLKYKLRCVSAFECLGEILLMIIRADGSAGIMTLDDESIHEISLSTKHTRMIFAHNGWCAGVSDDRCRVSVQQLGSNQPIQEFNILQHTTHRITDIAWLDISISS